jgi:hydroxymethylglutaryl-CoA lyase
MISRGALRSVRRFSSFSPPAPPPSVQLIEVGPRDGLQSESVFIPTDLKLNLINGLIGAGHKRIEATSFVSPKWIPQFKDANEVMAAVDTTQGVEYSVLTPNLMGAEAALSHPSTTVASVFGAASEGFTAKNINCTIDESIERFSKVVDYANSKNIKVRGYVSCIAGCPYQGSVPLSDVVRVYARMREMGIDEISLGDTIGVATPGVVSSIIEALVALEGTTEHIAVHCHDTYGSSLANILRALDHGVNKVDASVAGLGGCPYAGGGATGNVATEDVVYMLQGMGVDTGIDLEKLVVAGREVTEFLGIETRSKAGGALWRKMVKEGRV